MGPITNTMEARGESSPAVLDAAAILDKMAGDIVRMEPDSNEDRVAYWVALISTVFGFCGGSIGDEAALAVGENVVGAMRERLATGGQSNG